MTVQRIGPYELIRKLPGQPECYLGRSTGGESCVVRRIGPSSGEALAQAERDVGIVAGLPGVGLSAAVACIDGEHLGYVLPEREGTSLAQLVANLGRDQRPFEPAAVWHLGHATARALGAAHEAAIDDEPAVISHGFLSPDWIWLGWAGELWVDGVGLAALIDAPGLRSGAGFCAPEQLRGSRVTPRGDMYSLATIVWALLSGTDPGASPRFDAIASRVPEALRELLARALEPSLAKRTVTAAELEHAFGEQLGQGGQVALSNAVAPLRTGTSLLGTRALPRAPTPRAGMPRASAAASPFAGPPAPVKLPPRVGPPLRGELRPTPRAGTPAAAVPPRDVPPSYAIDDELSWGASADALGAAIDAAQIEPAALGEPAAAAPVEQAAPQIEPRPSDPKKSELAAKLDSAVDAVLNDESPSWVERSVPEVESLSALRGPESLGEEPPRAPVAVVGVVAAVEATREPTQPAAVDERAPDAEAAIVEQATVGAAPLSVELGVAQPAAPSGPSATESSKPISLMRALAVALITAASVFGSGVWWMMREQKLPEPPSASAESAGTASSSASSSARSPAVPATAEVAATAETRASAEPGLTASAEASATASASAQASAAPSAGVAPVVADSAALPPNQGHLTVMFSGEQGGEVFLLGTSIGKVGDKLTASCDKPVFVRIGKRNQPSDPPRWLTKGRTVKVGCQQHTEIRSAPGS